jgi:hypothetical protein
LIDRPADFDPSNEPSVTLVTQDGNTSADLIGQDRANVYAGGRWCELSLAYDGARLVIYRDNRRVAEKSAAITAIGIDDPDKDERIYAGIVRVPSIQADPIHADGAMLDDIRLERLGDGSAGSLPQGVTAQASSRIVCHPDGRVEVNYTAPDTNTVATDATIHLISDDGEAIIDVAVDGHLTTRLAVTP